MKTSGFFRLTCFDINYMLYYVNITYNLYRLGGDAMNISIKKIAESIGLIGVISIWGLIAFGVYAVLISLYGWYPASIVMVCFLLVKKLFGCVTTIIKD
jgi:hypothetical protein